MELEITMLGKLNKTQKDNYLMFSLLCGIQKEKKDHASRKGTVKKEEGDQGKEGGRTREGNG
jgi:hypothetical protein